MTRFQPPRPATWLLHALYSGPNREAITGDLAERYQSRGALWYWRQVIRAIAGSLFDDVRTHKLLAVRAIFTGCVASLLLRFLLGPVAKSPVGDLVELLTRQPRYLFFGAWAAVMVMPGAGWIVGRLHRGHAVGMVLVFALAVLLSNTPELERRVSNALIAPRYVPALQDFLVEQSLKLLAILCGGVLSAPRHREVS